MTGLIIYLICGFLTAVYTTKEMIKREKDIDDIVFVIILALLAYPVFVTSFVVYKIANYLAERERKG